MKGLTERQNEILKFIEQFMEQNRYAPSYREIGAHFGFSSLATVHRHIQTLKRKGILLHEGTSRALSLIDRQLQPARSQNSIEIPLIGNIIAGKPIQTHPRSQQITVPHDMVAIPDKTYALQVIGNSLNEELIADGDLLLVEVRNEVETGEIVLAVINGHDTIVKRYHREGEAIHLRSLDANHHPIIIHEEDLLVHGVLIALIRTYFKSAMASPPFA